MKFTDRAGREWDLALNVGTVMRVKADGHDLLELEEKAIGSDVKKLMALMEDDFAVLKWVWRFLADDAKKLNVSEKDLYESLGGLSLAEALKAWWTEYANFTRVPAIGSAIRERMRILDEGNKKIDAAMAKVLVKVKEKASKVLDGLSDEHISRVLDEELNKPLPSLVNTKTTSHTPQHKDGTSSLATQAS